MLIKLEWLGYHHMVNKLRRMLNPFHLIPERYGQTKFPYQYRASVCWRVIKTNTQTKSNKTKTHWGCRIQHMAMKWTGSTLHSRQVTLGSIQNVQFTTSDQLIYRSLKISILSEFIRTSLNVARGAYCDWPRCDIVGRSSSWSVAKWCVVGL